MAYTFNPFTGTLDYWVGNTPSFASVIAEDDGIATTDTLGIAAQNATAATAGVTVQQSPFLLWRSMVWNGGTLANWISDWLIESIPTTGGPPIGLLVVKSILNGTTTIPFQLDSNGNAILGSGATNPYLALGGVAAGDIRLKRAGTQLQIRTGNDGGDADLRVGNLTIAGANITLPASVFLTGSLFPSSSANKNTYDLGQSGNEMRSGYFGTGVSIGVHPARATFTNPADGQLVITNDGVTSGVGVDVTTDGTLKLRNRSLTAGTGALDLGAKLTAYNGVATVAGGVPAIYGTGRSVAQTAAVASVATYTVGAADGSFLVSTNVLVTTATLHTFTVECAYTSEDGTARVITFAFLLLAGTWTTSIANANGAVPYEGTPLHIRCKASTSITIRTQAAGTYTTVVYNVEGYITQIG